MSDKLENSEKELIRDRRRINRKVKKEEKRNRKEKEKEMKTLELKFGSKDTHVTLITKEFAKSLLTTTENLTNTDIKQDDFPFLGQKYEYKNKRNSQACSSNANFMENNNMMQENQPITFELKNSKKDLNYELKKSKAPIVLDIKDIIKTEANNLAIPVKQNITITYNDNSTYNGNMLDSSQPVRKRGKHREFPKSKKPNTLKATILKEKVNNEENLQHLNNYCDNIINDELNEIVSIFMGEIVNFQEKLYKRDPAKGVSKRRYVAGFHEIKKYLKVGKIRLIIFAPNLNITDDNSILLRTINDLKMLANAHDSSYIFALSRRKLGRLSLKNVPVSCIGILNYGGAEESYKQVLNAMNQSREEYKKIQSLSERKSVTDEISDQLLKVLKS